MKVTVGITTKNRATILPKAIGSALAQNYAAVDVVVFNDGSTDDTKELEKDFPTVRWIHREKSVGLLDARNIMMRESDADFFVSLDDDAWFLSNDEVSIAVAFMQTNPKCGAVAFDVLQQNTRRFKAVQRSHALPTNIFYGCGHLLRLSAVKQAGYYVPFPVQYGHEEKDLVMGLMDLGYEIWFLPGVHVWHDYTSLERDVEFQNRSFVINDLIFSYRRVPKIFLWLVLAKKIWTKLHTSDQRHADAKPAIREFFTLIPGQKEFIKRVRPATYRRYRKISSAYIQYIDSHAQQ